MPKYKYVDGVKYRVVPQSVLGYALVREDSDNSLPAGGTEGQVLAKASDTDFDVEWATVESESLPEGGTSGQVLAKASNTDYDVEWATVESGGDNTFVIIPYTVEGSTFTIQLDSATIAEYKQLILGGSLPILCGRNTGNDLLYLPDVYYNSSEEHVWQFASFRTGGNYLYLDVDSMTIMDEFD